MILDHVKVIHHHLRLTICEVKNGALSPRYAYFKFYVRIFQPCLVWVSALYRRQVLDPKSEDWIPVLGLLWVVSDLASLVCGIQKKLSLLPYMSIGKKRNSYEYVL